MKKLKILSSVLMCLLFSAINAQEKEKDEEQQYIFATFEIRDGRYNGSDITPEILKEKDRLIMYKSSDSEEIMFSNYWEKSNSQSYGSIYDITKEENPNKDEEFKHDLYRFYWSYINTYDNKEGTAEVRLLKVYKPRGIYFEITILPENLDELVYKGEMDSDDMVFDFNIKKQIEKQ